MFKRILTVAVATSSLAFAIPASAQQAGLVNVDIKNVLNNTDVDIQEVISRNNIDVTANLNTIVQVPVGLAANVCGISVLAAKNLSGPCDARSDVTSGQAQALINSMKRQSQ